MACQLSLNGEAQSVPLHAGATLRQLVDYLGFDPTAVIVECNGTLYKHAGLETTAICENDVIDIIHFIGGG